WNRRVGGAPNVTAADLVPWDRPDGPMVVPGRYAVRLTVDGKSFTQPFEILPDPRVTTKPQALAEQFDFLATIIATLTTVNAMINDIDSMTARLDLRSDERCEALRGELDAIRGALIDVHNREAQLWASGLHEKLNGLFDAVDSGDRAPSRQ